MPLGYVLTAYALVFFIGVFVGTNASDWLDRLEQSRQAGTRKAPPTNWRG